MRQFDHVAKSQFPQERQIIVGERAPIPSARHDDRRILGQVQERARIHMIVVIMGQEDGSRFRQQRSPERRDGRFRKPGEQPGIEQQHLVPLPIQQRGMAEMDRILIL